MIRMIAATHALVLLLTVPLAGQSDWRRNGVCYEVFVRSFYDSDGDGVGDLRGLIEKLDYINDGNPTTQRDLGASCIWLMPVAQSPSYHGYDVTNYYAINGDYGTNQDFKQLVTEAHRRGIRILVDLVLNHSSSEHPYFKSALLDSSSPFRDWYTWSTTVRTAPGWSAPVWHRAGNRNEYYYGLFWSGMPDLNLANPAVTAEAERIARFWLQDMGVDGFRLDAVAHFFEGPGGEVKHAPAVYSWLRDYSAALRRIKPAVYTIGEVWDSMGAVLKYYPDQLDAYFAFEVADAVFDAARSGSGERLIAAVQRAQREIPDGRWGMFLRNHDQTRTLTELAGDVARNKLAVSLLLTLPGLPFVYYGEEIGMTGQKQDGDPRLRTPMHWSRTPSAGFTRATPWEPLQPDSFTANVEVQDSDPNSLLNHHRRLIHLRTARAALGSGDFVPLLTSTPGALAYLRRTEREVMLVLANLTGQQLSGVSISSGEAVLPAARYNARTVLGGARATTLRVRGNRRMPRWVPAPTLAPFETQVIELR
ncbi:MAG: alpha-amylase family glycosyl hydrolase [Gemmatimonadota bacterium]